MNCYFRDFHVVFSEENNNLYELSLLDISYYAKGRVHAVIFLVFSALFREQHRKGRDHYHLAIKLDSNQWWMISKCYLQCTYGITVHYSSRHHNYFSAWLYVNKSHREFKESSGHSDLCNRGEPQTDLKSKC